MGIVQYESSIVHNDIEHRYRIEQRFTDSYANRFRYRLNISVPLNNLKMESGTLYASVYNDYKLPHFSRNRFHAGRIYFQQKANGTGRAIAAG